MTEDDTTTSETEVSDPEDAAGGRDVRRYLLYGALAILSLLAVVATIRFYLSASAAIAEWIAPEFRGLFQAAFNLIVLLAAGLGISLVLRELA